jgi:hypothetical protein
MSAAKREEEAGLAVAMGLSSRFTQSLSLNATGSKVWWLVLSSGGGYSTVYLVMFSGARLFSGLRCSSLR